MRVALVTRVGIEGDWEYSANLIEYLRRGHSDIEVSVIQPTTLGSMRAQCQDFDVVHFNFVYGMQVTNPGDLAGFGSRRVVLTFNENNPGDNANSHHFLRECARVIVHEKNPHGFIHIPHGIPVVEPCQWKESNDGVGTAGFPFSDKNIEAIASAARIAASNGNHRIRSLNIVAPHTAHADTWSLKQRVEYLFPGVNYVTEFYPQDKVLEILSRNLVNVFAPNSRRMGPSGSVRLGLATGSHMVLNRSMMFRDLFDYSDEIEFVEGDPSYGVSPVQIAQGIDRVLKNGKRPKRVLEDGSWTRCAELYAQVYRSVV
jgi:hypothetical protein